MQVASRSFELRSGSGEGEDWPVPASAPGLELGLDCPMEHGLAFDLPSDQLGLKTRSLPSGLPMKEPGLHWDELDRR